MCSKRRDPAHKIQKERFDAAELKSALLVGTYTDPGSKHLMKEYLGELEELGNTYGFETKVHVPCLIRKYDAATYIGKGKVEEILEICVEKKIDVVVFDDEIAPSQQKNLEEKLKRPVLDRTELILEVFAQRAQTKEAKLQIELARNLYQLPRLKRMWTHFSRQRSSGFVGGEGEKQIELDRRIFKTRIQQLEKELDQVAKQRKMERNLRQKTGIPSFAVIGYTNVGKSTLLNALTKAGILAEDKLFATLDATSRRFILPNKTPILLIDTVGLIRKLPHDLVASFRSTLEEALYADILLHVIDGSHPFAKEQGETTLELLKQLGVKDKPVITLINKIDAVEEAGMLNQLRFAFASSVLISAKEQLGFEELFVKMMGEIAHLRKIVTLRIPQAEYSIVAKVREEGRVIESEYVDNDVIMKVEIPALLEEKLRSYIFDEERPDT